MMVTNNAVDQLLGYHQPRPPVRLLPTQYAVRIGVIIRMVLLDGITD
jgi:hypothetical protein